MADDTGFMEDEEILVGHIAGLMWNFAQEIHQDRLITYIENVYPGALMLMDKLKIDAYIGMAVEAYDRWKATQEEEITPIMNPEYHD